MLVDSVYKTSTMYRIQIANGVFLIEARFTKSGLTYFGPEY